MIKICFICKQKYVPKHQTKYEAYISDDKESREQWLSGCCSTKCWDTLFVKKEESLHILTNSFQKHEVCTPVNPILK